MSDFFGVKNFVLCVGNMSQIYRNSSSRVMMHLPTDSKCCVEGNEILDLRYYPKRMCQLCRDAVTKLGAIQCLL